MIAIARCSKPLETGFCILELKFDTHDRPVDYKLVELNPAFERQTGLSNAVGRWVSEAVPVSADYRSLLISGRSGAKFGPNARADWVCEAARFPGGEIGLPKNI
jgi:hypothetical protein